MAQPITTEEWIVVSVLMVRCVHVWKRSVRWRIDPVRRECGLVTLLARLDEENRAFLDFHVLPNMDRRKRFDISLADPWLNRGQPLPKLSAFYEVVAQVRTAKREADC